MAFWGIGLILFAILSRFVEFPALERAWHVGLTICSAANWSRNEHGARSQYRSLVWSRPFSSSESFALTSRVIGMGFSTEPAIIKYAPVWQHYMQHWWVSIQCQGCVGPWWKPCTYFGNQKNWLHICGEVLLGLQIWLIGSYIPRLSIHHILSQHKSVD